MKLYDAVLSSIREANPHRAEILDPKPKPPTLGFLEPEVEEIDLASQVSQLTDYVKSLQAQHEQEITAIRQEQAELLKLKSQTAMLRKRDKAEKQRLREEIKEANLRLAADIESRAAREYLNQRESSVKQTVDIQRDAKGRIVSVNGLSPKRDSNGLVIGFE